MTATTAQPSGLPTRAKSRRLQRLRHQLIHGLAQTLVLLGRFLPERVPIIVGRSLGWLIFALAGRARRLTRDQIAQRLELPPDQAMALARRVFLHLGENLGEWLVLPRWRRRFDDVVDIDADAMAQVADAYAQGRGIVVATAHFGNWELLAQYLAARGFAVNVVSTQFVSPEMTRFQERWRHAGLVRTVYRGRSALIRAMLRVFRRGEGLGVMVDIDTKAPSVFVPFFGELAKTPRTPADLALRTGAFYCLAYAYRVGPGRHRVHMERIDVTRSGDRDEDARRMTAEATRRLEAIIRQHPEQWVWMHRRWKTRPQAQQDPLPSDHVETSA